MKYITVGGTSDIGLATAKMAVDADNSVLAVGRDPGKFSRAHAIGATMAQLDASNFEANQRLFSEEGAFGHLVLSISTQKRRLNNLLSA